MNQSEGSILAWELSKLGGPGAWLAARFLPLNVGEQTVLVREEPARVHAALLREVPGRFRAQGEVGGAPLQCILGAGTRSLNPTMLTISIQSAPGGAEVHIRAAAKEGLKKQRAGEEVLRRVLALLRGSFRVEVVQRSSAEESV